MGRTATTSSSHLTLLLLLRSARSSTPSLRAEPPAPGGPGLALFRFAVLNQITGPESLGLVPRAARAVTRRVPGPQRHGVARPTGRVALFAKCGFVPHLTARFEFRCPAPVEHGKPTQHAGHPWQFLLLSAISPVRSEPAVCRD